MTNPDIPDGFAPHFKSSPFTKPWEPLYSRIGDNQIQIGTWLREVHCNSRGFVHGGFVSSIADNAMGLTCGHALQSAGREVSSLVTISLNVDFVGIARVGQWFETQSDVIRLTRAIGFINCLLKAEGEIVARATSNFKIN